MVSSLTEEIEHRMNKFESSDIDQQIVRNSLDAIDIRFSTLQNHAKIYAREGVGCIG